MTAEEIDSKMATLMESHVAKMAEISDEGIRRSKELMDQSVTAITKQAGIRNILLDKALETIGITEPTEQ